MATSHFRPVKNRISFSSRSSALDVFFFPDMDSTTFQLNTVLACCDDVEPDSSRKQMTGSLTASLCETAGGVENFFGGCELEKKALINSLLPAERGAACWCCVVYLWGGSAGAPWQQREGLCCCRLHQSGLADLRSGSGVQLLEDGVQLVGSRVNLPVNTHLLWSPRAWKEDGSNGSGQASARQPFSGVVVIFGFFAAHPPHNPSRDEQEDEENGTHTSYDPSLTCRHTP